MKKHKKGQIQDLQNLIAPLVGVAIVLVVGFLIFAQVKVQVGAQDGVNPTNCSKIQEGGNAGYNLSSIGCNATQTIQNAMQTIPGWLPIYSISC